VRALVSDVFEELLTLAKAQDCSFPADFKQKTMAEMIRPTEANSIMYQDFAAKRPMEVETYLGSPIKLAQSVGIRVPRIETLYAILHNLNIVNQQRKDVPAASPVGMTPPARLSSVPPARQMMNGGMNGAMNGAGPGPGRGRGRAPSMNGLPPNMRRGPPPMNGGPPNGYGRPVTGNGYPPPRNSSRRGSLEGNDLEEFSHLVLYDDIPESGESNYGDGSDLALRERELMLRQRELALREQELRLRSGGRGPRRGPPTPSVRNGGFDDDEDDGYFDPADAPAPPLIDPDNFDMMSVTSRRNRKAPSASQLRKNPEYGDVPQGRRGGGYMRPGFPRNRSSARIISQTSGLHDNIMDDPMMGYSSNRYGNVDRQQMGLESRTNSLTAARLDELQYGGPQNGQAPGYGRRASQSPGNPYSPQMGRGNGRPSPPNGYMGPPTNGRPSPPGGMRQPVPRHPPGQGNAVAPQQVEQYAGVSALHPPKGPMNVRSLTGSASASAGSGDSANIDSEPSAHSSQSSLGNRPPIGVR
jgi:Ketopantoate reductase PanE/ApbA C terminal